MKKLNELCDQVLSHLIGQSYLQQISIWNLDNSLKIKFLKCHDVNYNDVSQVLTAFLQNLDFFQFWDWKFEVIHIKTFTIIHSTKIKSDANVYLYAYNPQSIN